jgi:hypothetical protein
LSISAPGADCETMLFDVAIPFIALAPAAEPDYLFLSGTSQWSFGIGKANARIRERVASLSGFGLTCEAE